MKRLTIIIILLILIPLSVEALYVQDEEGNRNTCIDISKESWDIEWHNYIIKDNSDIEADSYRVVDAEGYPKPMHEEKGISPYGYRKDYSLTEYSTKIEQYKEQYRLTEPEGKHVYVRYMSWVPFTIDDAAKEMAEQQFYFDYFVPDDGCKPCNEKGLTESSGECVTCYERWGANWPVFNNEPDYKGDDCLSCPEGTKWDGKECAGPTTEPTATPTPTTTTPAPTTVPPTTTPTTTPTSTTMPPTTSPHTTTPHQTTLPPTTMPATTTVPPQTTKPPDKPDELGPYDEDKGYCGPNNLYAYSGHIITKGIGDFGRACYNHDICYSSSGVSRKECDQLFLTDMGDDCLNKSGLKGFTCFAASQVAYAGVRFVGWAFYEPWSGFF